MWIPLLVCLFYDTRLGPDHKRNQHTMSPNEFLDRSDRYGTGHAMDNTNSIRISPTYHHDPISFNLP